MTYDTLGILYLPNKTNVVDCYFYTNLRVYSTYIKTFSNFYNSSKCLLSKKKYHSQDYAVQIFISQNRLNGLARMNIRRDIKVAIDNVINQLAITSIKKIKINL